MNIVTNSIMKALDRKTIDEIGIPGQQLMEKAGEGVADVADTLLKDTGGKKVAVFCGKGNNGGDGFVAARHLAGKGYSVEVFLVGAKDELKGDARLNLKRAVELGIPVYEINESPANLDFEMIIDAIFGTGFRGKIGEPYREIIDAINKTNIPVVSVDMPSGIDGDTGQDGGTSIYADATVTFAYPKLGHIFYPGRGRTGELYIVDIGVPSELIEEISPRFFADELEDIAGLLPRRFPDMHKGDAGKVLVVAGSKGMTGAAYLSAISCLRSGAGLVYLAVPEGVAPVLEMKATEAVKLYLPNIKNRFAISLRSLGVIYEYLSSVDALIIGPGLGRHYETREAVLRIAQKTTIPTLFDADALFALAKDREIWKKIKAPYIITPHSGEFARIIDAPVKEVSTNRLKFALEYKDMFADAVLLLKGNPTIIAQGDKIYLNPTGNDGMATAGSGDVLSGLIGGFLAQGCSPLDAARLGAYIHGLAGDIAAERLTTRAMIAGDIMLAIPDAFAEVENLTSEE